MNVVEPAIVTLHEADLTISPVPLAKLTVPEIMMLSGRYKECMKADVVLLRLTDGSIRTLKNREGPTNAHDTHDTKDAPN